MLIGDSNSTLAYQNMHCATCQGPLRTSTNVDEGYEPMFRCAVVRTHVPHVCCHTECSLKFWELEELRAHFASFKHLASRCTVPWCQILLSDDPDVASTHFKEAHKDLAYLCAECSAGFNTRGRLDYHAKKSKHSAYHCQFPDCKSESSCFKELTRHQLSHQSNARRYPCSHCRR